MGGESKFVEYDFGPHFTLVNEGPVQDTEHKIVIANKIARLLENNVTVDPVKLDEAEDPDWERHAQPGFD